MLIHSPIVNNYNFPPSTLDKYVVVVICPNPMCAIFGFTDETCYFKGRDHVVIAFTSLLARHLMYFLKLEKIDIYILNIL